MFQAKFRSKTFYIAERPKIALCRRKVFIKKYGVFDRISLEKAKIYVKREEISPPQVKIFEK